MASTGQLPNGKQQFLDQNGDPLAFGKVYFYIPATLTPKNTWQDIGQVTLNTNPITLDLSGEAVIFGTGAYRQIVKDSLGNTIWDQLTYDPGYAASSNLPTVEFLAIAPDGTESTQAQDMQHRFGYIFDAQDFSGVEYANAAVDSGPFLNSSAAPAGTRIKITNELYFNTDVTIVANLFFEGGAIIVASGKVATFTGKIIADTNQYIFKGAGTVNLSSADIEGVSAQWFGAKGDGSTDDTAAIQEALNTGLPVQLLAQTYVVSGNLDANYSLGTKSNKMKGVARGKTILRCTANAVPILKVGGTSAQISDMTLQYSSHQTDAAANCLQLTTIQQSTFARLRLLDGTQSLKCSDYVQTTSFHDLLCLDYDSYGVYFQFSGNGFGIRFSGLFFTSTTDGSTLRQTQPPCYLDNIGEVIISGVTWYNCKALSALNSVDVDNCVISGAHIENFTPAGGDNSAFLRQIGGVMIVQGATFVNCSVLVGNIPTNYALYKITVAAKLCVDGTTEIGGTRTTGTWYALDAASGTVIDRAVAFTLSSAVNSAPGNVTADYPYQLMNFGRQLWAFKFGSGQKNWIDGTAAPASGTWAVGDIVWQSDSAAGGYVGWYCTTAGTPGTWKQFGAILP